MATEFQIINRAAQAAISSVREFAEEYDEPSEDDIELWISSALEDKDIPRKLWSYFDAVWRASLDAYLELHEEDED